MVLPFDCITNINEARGAYNFSKMPYHAKYRFVTFGLGSSLHFRLQHAVVRESITNGM